ncbi:MAG: 50S ribosomal protein L22 [Patescibacteria group bacterium]|nr:50S ribosomal protein L22 [Patescibacteria group bacterium]
MEVQTIQKNIHTSTRKLQLVSQMVRQMKPLQALHTLGFVNKAAAQPLSKALQTAIANAKQKNLNEENLIFKKLEINEGPKMRRFRAGSRGRAKMYKKRLSHIKIVLSDEVEEVKSKSKNLKNKDQIKKGESA